MKFRHFLAVSACLGIIPALSADPAPLQPSAAPSAQSFKDGLEAYRLGQFRRALAILEPIAGKGDVQAQFTLAMMYSGGNGVELDEYRAARWFELAASQGHRDAEYFLARLYEQGWGIPLSPDQAVQWYRRCAEQGDKRCSTRLAVMNGEKPDWSEKPEIVTEPAPVAPAESVVSTTENRETAPAAGEASTPLPNNAATPPVADPAVPAAPPAQFLGEDWVRAQKPTHYTLQLLSSTNEQDIRNYVQRYDLKGVLAIVPELRQGRIWYSLLYGIYQTNSAANKARAILPAEVKADAWGRRFSKLRASFKPTQD